MKLTIDQLKGLGYIETRPGHWHKGSELVVGPADNPKPLPKPAKRIRQSSKPILNKLEQEWFDKVSATYNPAKIHAQSATFKLANGLRYTPDLFCFDYRHTDSIIRSTAWEVKGRWFTDDANAKLKMFASLYPEILVMLVWKQNGQWISQIVLP